MKVLTKTLIITALTFSVAACGSNHKTERRTATGAAIGGLAGYVLSGGDTATALGAAALGGVAGNVYDSHKEKQEDKPKRRANVLDKDAFKRQ